nr:MAG TPA: hypothetical protein [Caudoviricetes sp.]
MINEHFKSIKTIQNQYKKLPCPPPKRDELGSSLFLCSKYGTRSHGFP